MCLLKDSFASAVEYYYVTSSRSGSDKYQRYYCVYYVRRFTLLHRISRARTDGAICWFKSSSTRGSLYYDTTVPSKQLIHGDHRANWFPNWLAVMKSSIRAASLGSCAALRELRLCSLLHQTYSVYDPLSLQRGNSLSNPPYNSRDNDNTFNVSTICQTLLNNIILHRAISHVHSLIIVDLSYCFIYFLVPTTARRYRSSPRIVMKGARVCLFCLHSLTQFHRIANQLRTWHYFPW